MSGENTYTGGDIHNNSGTITLSNSTISGNSATSDGGAVSLSLGQVIRLSTTALLVGTALKMMALNSGNLVVTLLQQTSTYLATVG
ncbi:MAG: hypothetical protein V3U88_10625 [Methylococcales bacterium]